MFTYRINSANYLYHPISSYIYIYIYIIYIYTCGGRAHATGISLVHVPSVANEGGFESTEHVVQMPEFDPWERHVTILCRALNATLLHVCGAVSAAPGTGKSQGMARAFVNGRAELQFDNVISC